jgi:hypothetical protein
VDTSAITALSGDVTAAMTQMFAAEAAAQPVIPATSPAPPVAAPVAQPVVAVPGITPPVPTPVAPAPPAQSPSLQPPPSEATPTQAQTDAVNANAINDQALYSVPQSDGTVAMMSGKELREGVLRQSDYTRKTQELARQRQAAEAVAPQLQQLQAQQAALDADLRNPAAVAQYLVNRFGPQVAQQHLQQLLQNGQVPPPAPAPITNPDEFASQGYVAQQAQTLAAQIQQQKAQLQQLQAQLQQEAQLRDQAAQQAETRALNQFQVQTARATIDQALPAIIEANPLIKAIPHHADLLRYNVLSTYKPQTPQEAIQCFQIEAQKLSAGLLAAYQGQQKTQLVAQQQQQLANNGLATVSGTPLTAQPTGPRLFIGADGRGDFKALSSSVLEFMKSQQAQQG